MYLSINSKLVLLAIYIYTIHIAIHTKSDQYTLCQASFLANFFCRHTWTHTGHMCAYIHACIHTYVLDVRAGLLKLERSSKKQYNKSVRRYGLDVARILVPM